MNIEIRPILNGNSSITYIHKSYEFSASSVTIFSKWMGQIWVEELIKDITQR